MPEESIDELIKRAEEIDRDMNSTSSQYESYDDIENSAEENSTNDLNVLRHRLDEPDETRLDSREGSVLEEILREIRGETDVATQIGHQRQTTKINSATSTSRNDNESRNINSRSGVSGVTPNRVNQSEIGNHHFKMNVSEAFVVQMHEEIFRPFLNYMIEI